MEKDKRKVIFDRARKHVESRYLEHFLKMITYLVVLIVFLLLVGIFVGGANLVLQDLTQFKQWVSLDNLLCFSCMAWVLIYRCIEYRHIKKEYVSNGHVNRIRVAMFKSALACLVPNLLAAFAMLLFFPGISIYKLNAIPTFWQFEAGLIWLSSMALWVITEIFLESVVRELAVEQ